MEISITDLCKYLGVSRTTIERWIRQGKFPEPKRGSAWTFQSMDLKRWASKNNITLNFEPRPDPKSGTKQQVSLSEALEAGGVYHQVSGGDIASVLNACIEKIDAVQKKFKAGLLEQLTEREEALSTGVGGGVAIPHPRTPLTYLAQPVVAACFLKNPVDYKALDNQPVFVLFFILYPELTFHLQLLSSLSFCLRNKEFSRFLKTCPEKSELIERIDTLQLSEKM